MGSTSTAVWSRRSLPVVLGANAACLAGLLLAWWGASGEVDVDRQGGWLALATAVSAAGAVLNVMSVVTARQRIRRTTRLFLERAKRCFPGPACPVAPGSSNGWLAVEGRTRYLHRPGCPLLAGKAVRSVPVGGARSNHYELCGVCGR